MLTLAPVVRRGWIVSVIPGSPLHEGLIWLRAFKTLSLKTYMPIGAQLLMGSLGFSTNLLMVPSLLKTTTPYLLGSIASESFGFEF